MRFSNRFSYRFQSFSGAVSFCRHAALTNSKNHFSVLSAKQTTTHAKSRIQSASQGAWGWSPKGAAMPAFCSISENFSAMSVSLHRDSTTFLNKGCQGASYLLWQDLKTCSKMLNSGTEKVPQRTFATEILPNFRVNFLVRFASNPLFYWAAPTNFSENS